MYLAQKRAPVLHGTLSPPAAQGCGMTTEDQSRERYSMGYDAYAREMMTQRTATRMADYLLPHLRPGMRLLDVGCGPGSITLGLAELVAPGEVVGVDIEQAQLDDAQVRAAEAGLTNIRFVPGTAYALPFPDASFDAVFASALLQHLGEPVRALREFRRVLRPGGVAGINDPDWTDRVHTPSTPLLERMVELRVQLYEANGGSPGYASHQRRLLLEAGFARAESYPVANGGGTPAALRDFSWRQANEFREFRNGLIAHGLADGATVDAIVAEIETWAQRPDAMSASMAYRGLGWVDES
jgi:SAM-dependent methyltransferase